MNKINKIILSMLILLLLSSCASTAYKLENTKFVNVAYVDTGAKTLLGDDIFITSFSGLLEGGGNANDIKSNIYNKKLAKKVKWVAESVGDHKIALNKSVKYKVEDLHPWDVAHEVFRYKIKKDLSVLAVEPEYTNIGNDDEPNKNSDDGSATIIGVKPSVFWPNGKEINWHHGNSYTQLADARKTVANVPENKQPLIAHLDTGYTIEDELKPNNFSSELSRDFVGNNGGISKDFTGHGVRTLGSLAGDIVNVSSDKYIFNDYLGANPYARIVEYRIHKSSPVHFNSRAMGSAIMAATKAEADVISLSAGGFPSFLQRDAVNTAYMSGTAVIAATGNHFVVPVFGFRTPNMVGFPARYNQVLAVAGVTKDHKSYSDADCYFCLLTNWSWTDWMLRGNSGPASVMKGKSISAYSPNIAYSAPTKSNHNRIGLDGGGASHATTQVAGAAAIWLQNNRDQIEKNGEWRTWKKTEAVYQALMLSAAKKDEIKNHTIAQMGEGVLRANRALSFTYNKLKRDNKLKERAASKIGSKWVLELFTRSNIPYFSNAAKPGFIKMLGLELAQHVYNEKHLNDLYLEVKDCVDELSGIVNCTALKKEILAEIYDKSEISNTLKSALETVLAKL